MKHKLFHVVLHEYKFVTDARESAIKTLDAADVPYSLFLYGSSVYGTLDDESDVDFIAVFEKLPEAEFDFDDSIDVSMYDRDTFLKMANDHDIAILECIFLMRSYVVRDDLDLHNIDIEIDKSKLRKSISARCSNSYAKARKKITVEKDYNLRTAYKSMFHSIRMYEYGRQIAVHGSIISYHITNDLYDEIRELYLKNPRNWDKIHSVMKPIFNQYATEFKLKAPKCLISKN